jgi:hypothetical protein
MARHLISSDATIRVIKPSDPRKRLSDGDGLVLLLFVNGGSHGWRFDYRFGGKRTCLPSAPIRHDIGHRSSQGRCSASTSAEG